MRTMYHYLLSSLLLVLLLGFTACDFRDIMTQDEFEQTLDDENATLYLLDIDWSEMDEEPTGMTVLFYPSDGRFPYIRLSNEVHHYEVALPTDDYRILVFNQSENEFGYLTFSGMNAFETAQVEVKSDYDDSQSRIDRLYNLPSNTSTNGARWNDAEDDDTRAKVVRQTAMTVKGLGTATASTSQSSTVVPRASTRAKVVRQTSMTVKPRVNGMTINVRVRGLSNNPLNDEVYVSAVNGAITGLATGTFLTSESYTTGSLTQELDEWDINSASSPTGIGSISCHFGVFGISPDVNDSPLNAPSRAVTMMNAETYVEAAEEDDTQNILYLNFRLSNGTYVPYRFNVTRRIREQLEEDIIELSLDIGISLDGTELDDPLILPDAGLPYGGMQITVQDWGETINQVISLE